jgi:hypothetical protein
VSAADKLGAPIADRSAWPTLTMMLLGCFGRDAGSTKWPKRSFYALAVMLIGMVGSSALKGYVPELALSFFVTLNSGLAMGIIYWTTWRYMQDLDELHRRVMFEAIAFSFVVTMTLAMTLGVLELAFRTNISIVWAFVMGEILRGVGLVLASRKYR